MFNLLNKLTRKSVGGSLLNLSKKFKKYLATVCKITYKNKTLWPQILKNANSAHC